MNFRSTCFDHLPPGQPPSAAELRVLAHDIVEASKRIGGVQDGVDILLSHTDGDVSWSALVTAFVLEKIPRQQEFIEELTRRAERRRRDR